MFESGCGTRKHIDFILCNQDLHLVLAHATFDLDLGSDHHAVTVCLDFGWRQIWKTIPFRRAKRWKPPVDQHGVPHACHAILEEEFNGKQTAALSALEDVLSQSVQPVQIVSTSSMSKPVWRDRSFRNLICKNAKSTRRPLQRPCLSKLFQKPLRRDMRQRRNARTSQILSEFCAWSWFTTTQFVEYSRQTLVQLVNFSWFSGQHFRFRNLP